MDKIEFILTGTGKDLFQALFEAKKQLGSTVAPAGHNPHFKSDYIQLDTLVKKIDPVAQKCGLVISHFPTGTGLITLLIHKDSGQHIQFYYELVLERQTAQGVSSSLTYAKRQILQSMFNLSAGEEEDDDGEAAENREAEKEKSPAKEKSGGKKSASSALKTTKFAIQNMTDLEELKLYFGTMPVTYQNDDKIVELFKAKKAEIGMQAN